MLLKFLDKYNRGPYSEFDFSEYLPTKKTDGTWKPGKWLPKVGYLEMCERGYHATDKEHMLEWLNSNLYEIEARGTKIEGDDKIAFAQIRFVRKIETWNDKSARLFACWCARQVWHLMTDKRSRNAVEVAERHANGEATDEELAAAWAAAWDAARDAAWDAARAAARDAAWAAARDAAWDAARDAAWAAARAAARDAAWAAQREALIKIVFDN